MADRSSLETAKVESAIGNRVLAYVGLAAGVRASLGHVSMRVPGDPNLFVVKGRGYRMDVLSRMRPEDMVVCDLEGNWVDGPPYSLQCSEVKIHSCIYKNRPDVASVVHVHPDYVVLMSVLENGLKPMAQEGVGLVTRPLPLYRRTKIITSEEEGQEVARLLGNGDVCLLLGHGAVTASTSGVEGAVLAMVHLEHQARLNYLAMCAAGPNHPSIPLNLAEEVALARPEAEPHLKARLANVPGGRVLGGIWPYFREVVTANM
ncbi:MAG: class II aldolase/adducin family protein [Nitrospinae bacterium]|nr:class II aldolase/adducin family protein [Nitrospinota bacterium]